MKNKKEIPCPYEHSVTDYQDFTLKSTPKKDREKLGVGDIWSNKIMCNKCGWYIRSKNQHNFVKCKCGECFVDGGSWYQRIGGKDYTNCTEYYDK